MERLERATPAGRLRIVGADAAELEAGARLAERLACELAKGGLLERLEFHGRAAYCKASRLRGRARARHVLRGWLLHRPPPCVREYENLAWLSRHEFLAARPLVAGSLARAGAVWMQFLVTEEIPEASTLDAVLADELEGSAREALIDELAGEVARMHSAGFVHRDLYPRNLLVGQGARRIHFIDAWAGGPCGSGMFGGVSERLRGPAHDLGCLMLDGRRLFTKDEQLRLFERYLAGRKEHGYPERAQPFLEAVRAAREAQRSRLVRRPGRLHGAALPEAEWPEWPGSRLSSVGVREALRR